MSFNLLISKKVVQGYKGVMFSNIYSLAQLKVPHTLHYALITPLHPDSTVASNPAWSVTPLADCCLRRVRGTGTAPRPSMTAPPARRHRLEAHRRPSKPRRPPPVNVTRLPVRLPPPSAPVSPPARVVLTREVAPSSFGYSRPLVGHESPIGGAFSDAAKRPVAPRGTNASIRKTRSTRLEVIGGISRVIGGAFGVDRGRFSRLSGALLQCIGGTL